MDEPQIDRLSNDSYEAARTYLPTLPAKQESLFDLAIISIQERVRALGEWVGIKDSHRMIVGIPTMFICMNFQQRGYMPNALRI